MDDFIFQNFRIKESEGRVTILAAVPSETVSIVKTVAA